MADCSFTNARPKDFGSLKENFGTLNLTAASRSAAESGALRFLIALA